RVSDELLDRAAVALEYRSQLLERSSESPADHLGVARLSEGRRADEVAKEDRDDLALLPRTLGDGERRGAGHAEARLGRVLDPAARAGLHAGSLGANRLQLGQLDVVRKRRRERWIEPPRADLAHGSGSGRDRQANRVIRRPLVADRGEELGEEDV